MSTVLPRMLPVWVFLWAACVGAEAKPLRPGDPDSLVRAWEFDGADAEGWGALHSLEPLAVADGTLRTRATGEDAYMGISSLGLDTAGISHVQVRMRSTEPGSCQIYFTTSTYPDPAKNANPVFPCPGDNEFREFEVQLAGVAGWEGMLDLLRLDPVNGQGATASIEVDWIRLVDKAPRPVVVSFAADTAWARPGDAITLRAQVRNIGGGSLDGLTARLQGGSMARTLERDAAGEYGVSWETEAQGPALMRRQAHVLYGKRMLATAETAVLVIEPAEVPEPDVDPGVVVERGPLRFGPSLIGPQTAVMFVGDAEGCGAAVVLGRADKGKPWKLAGLCLPLATLAVRTGDQDRMLAPSFEMAAVNTGPVPTVVGKGLLPEDLGLLNVNWSVDQKPGVEAAASFGGSTAGVLRFSGPTFLAGAGAFGEGKDAALFPGLEYLGRDEPSSDASATGKEHGLRVSPPPHHITVPLMAVEAKGLLCGLMWSATEPWSGTLGAETEVLPMAEFASPNSLDAQGNHRMAVFVPTAPRWADANTPLAREPYEMGAGKSLQLKTHVFAIDGLSCADAVPVWYRTYGAALPAPLVKPPEAFLDDLMTGWAKTCYSPEKDGFVSHWRFGLEPQPGPDRKADIFGRYLETGNAALIESVGLEETTQLIVLLGPLYPAILDAPAPPEIAAQRPDGTWPYTCTDQVRKTCEEITGGEKHALGREGDTNVGICAIAAHNILSDAIRTGRAESIAAGLRALDAMGRFRVPAGAQVWEVHMDAPDVYAAAQAADCFRMGYQLTGEKRYLDQALYWAYTGLPFFYAYAVPGTGAGASCVVPGDGRTEGPDPFEGLHPASEVFQNADRAITPYASIPVFGTTFYRLSWFGTVVQWCGMRWAEAVYRLLDYRDDPLLRVVAQGALHSGCHQTFDVDPITGLLPDVWRLEDNMIMGAFIGPSAVEPALRAHLRNPDVSQVRTEVFLDGVGRLHVNVRGGVEKPRLEAGALYWDQRYPTGQVCEALVVGVTGAPLSVMAGKREMDWVRDLDENEEGWEYVADRHCLRLRVLHRSIVEPVKIVLH